MDITFAAFDLPADHDALVQFMLSNEFLFHVNVKPSRNDLDRKISGGAFGGPDHASFWVDAESEGRIGPFVVAKQPLRQHGASAIMARDDRLKCD